MEDIRIWLEKNILLFDGAMGTWYAQRNRAAYGPCEQVNLTDPAEIAAIHRAYLEAGCRAIKTNTFAANRRNFPEADCAAILRGGWRIAREAAGENAYVFADVGPVEPENGAEALPEYLWVADRFLELGARCFLFETNGTDVGLRETAAHIKAAAPDAFILVSFAVQPDGFTRSGLLAKALLSAAAGDENVDAVGFNCISGPGHMAELLRRIGTPAASKLFSAMPNAGYPTVRGGRTFYDGDPSYFARKTAELREMGVRILGGCCGTTPEHIAALARALRVPAAARVSYPVRAERRAPEGQRFEPFWEALCDPALKPFAVELDPPEGADAAKFMDGARLLRDGGADAVTVADCPVGRARMDSSLMACKLKRELGIDALPHLTCRDRNRNATQALLMGLCAEGIGNILVVTGDPLPSASRDEVKSVYQYNSRALVSYISGLNEAVLPSPFRIFCALNVNARNFESQLRLAREKEENGACGFLTQPVLTPQALENLKTAREQLKGKLLGGVMPIVSQRNAQFLNSEIAGITVDPRIIDAYASADRARGEELAVEISGKVAEGAAPWVDGFYIMTPFGRAGLSVRVMDRIRETLRL